MKCGLCETGTFCPVHDVATPPAEFGKPPLRVGLLERLLISVHLDGELREKSDAEIADLLLQEVWSEEDVTTKRCALIEHAIDRLHRAKGGPLPPDEDP